MPFATLLLGTAMLATAAAVGSFLNVLALRLPLIAQGVHERGKAVSLSHPDSRCPGCHSRILWRYNIPILGWLALRGRCRNCKAIIPARYPLTEAGAAALAALTLLAIGPTPEAGLLICLQLSLYALAVSKIPLDLRPARTRHIKSVMLVIPLLIATIPWLTISKQTTLDPNPFLATPALAGLCVIILFEIMAGGRGHRLTLLCIPLAATLLLLFTPLSAAGLWVAANISAGRLSRSHNKPLAATWVALPALLLLAMASPAGTPAIQLLSPAWASLLHPTP